MTITGSTINNNSNAGGNGAGIHHSTGTLTITSSTISGNTGGAGLGGSNGGGIYNGNQATSIVHIHSSTISNNSAGSFGGGILSAIGPGTVTIDDSIGTGSTISGNTAGLSGGGVSSFASTTTTISGNTTTTGTGGGIHSDGPLTVTNSSVSGNTATVDGGGISHRFGIGPAKLLSLTNVTISGNSATAGSGGGISAGNSLNATNTTITKNSATNVGGGIDLTGGSTVNLKNTIVANQTMGADCSGNILASTLNDLDSDGSCGAATTAANALLGPLAANGGTIPPLTHTLLTGSPALDAGDVATCTNAPVNNLDQRGLPRPQGIGCDIGAVEANHQPQPTAPDILNLNLNAGNPGTSQVTHHDPDTVNPGNAWSYFVQTAPTNGTATVNATGLVSYTPNVGWIGPDSFVIKVQDDGILPLSGVVTVFVREVNRPPAPTAPAITTNEDTAGASQIAPNDPNVGDAHTYAVTTPPANGGAVVSAAGLATYTPNLNFNGTDSFTVKVTDNGTSPPNLFASVTINVTVNPVNDAPAPTAPAITTNEDTQATSQVTHNDPDVGDTHTYAVTTPPANGGATVNAAGLATYTPNLNFNGADSFIVTVTDAAGATGAVTINATVNAVNDAPAPTAPAMTTNAGVAITSQVTHHDPDVGDTHTYAVTTAAAHGTASVNAAGLANYVPNAGFSGVDSFVVTVTDAANATGTVTINVTVNAVVATAGGGGGVINPSTSFDPTMLLMLLFSTVYLLRRRKVYCAMHGDT